MELADAVAKASEGMTAPPLGLAGTPDGIEFIPSPYEAGSYDYLQQIVPLVKKWGDVVGNKIADRAGDLGRLTGLALEKEGAADDEQWIEESNVIFRKEGTEVCCGVFALGYLLGSPDYDRLPHDAGTFSKALKEDRDTHRILTNRFAGEEFLKDRFYEYITVGATIISMAYRQLDLPHNKENLQSWGRLCASFGIFDAFRVGLATRRVMEEALTFDQFAKDFDN